MSYQRIAIKGEPYLKGEPPLKKVRMYGLNVGDRVTQVGTGGGRKSGKVTSSARIDNFTPWIEYSGIYVIEESAERIEYMAFKLPPAGVTNAANKIINGPFYKLFIVFLSGDLLVPNQDQLTTRLYRGCFLHYKEVWV